ncbi:MAG: hypothetical protein ACYCO9_08215 [Streptosporangiaceae bacterium]
METDLIITTPDGREFRTSDVRSFAEVLKERSPEQFAVLSLATAELAMHPSLLSNLN